MLKLSNFYCSATLLVDVAKLFKRDHSRMNQVQFFKGCLRQIILGHSEGGGGGGQKGPPASFYPVISVNVDISPKIFLN